MRSSWPIVIGVAFLGAAAAWYDAKNEASSVLQADDVHEAPSAAEASFASAETPQERVLGPQERVLGSQERVLGTTKPETRPLVGTTR
jgi:hypothetical protein